MVAMFTGERPVRQPTQPTRPAGPRVHGRVPGRLRRPPLRGGVNLLSLGYCASLAL